MSELLRKICTACGNAKRLNEFHKQIRGALGVGSVCKTCRKTERRFRYVENKERELKVNAEWMKKNKAQHLRNCKKYNRREGYGVYKVIYPEGIYIGSGMLSTRRRNHLSGNSGVGRKLGSRAKAFEILLTCLEDQCLENEQIIIDSIGLSNLLNHNNTYSKKNRG